MLDRPVAAGAATVRVKVEDVSRADGAAEVVAEISLAVERNLVAGESLSFSLPVAGIDNRHHYAVRVHVDTRGDGLVHTGDQLSTQSFPVLTHGAGDDVTVKVSGI